ncbi:uncharacterized protein LOC108682928, partial [Hyalella azteca]|uniref:Uncharacterized protein LOC108682928 n=1 Tax=Hyalella azteca TaxID=294128 RepID=A0A8B7PQZ7_HYAAZ
MHLSSIISEMLRGPRVLMMLLSVLHGTGVASTGSSRYRVHPQAGFGIADPAAVVHYTSSAIQCAQRCSISGSSVFSVTEENTGKVRCRIASSGFRAENLTAGAAAAGETTYVDELTTATEQALTTAATTQ